MKYVSINKLNNIIKKNINKIPNDIDLIVANPRSGFLPAIIISLLKNLPICDIDSLNENKIFSYGTTKNNNFINNISAARKILIVEDSSYSGESLRIIRNKIPDKIKDKCILLVVFSNSKTKDLTDIYFEIIDETRMFEWNLFHHSYLRYAGLDLNVIFEKNIFNIKPTQLVEAIIIEDNKNKDEIINKLKKSNIKFNRVIYKHQIDENIKFIISNENKKFNEFNVDIIDYKKGTIIQNGK